jgi:hypothetical protein
MIRKQIRIIIFAMMVFFPFHFANSALVASTKKAAKNSLGLVGLYDDPSQDNSAADLGSADAAGRNYPLKLTTDGNIAYVSVPWSDADTHWASGTIIGKSNSDIENSAASNTALYLNHVENGSVKNSHKIGGTGGVSASSDKDGNLTITGTAATVSALGMVKLGSDKKQTVAANTPSSTSYRTYPIQNNSSGQLVVNVPWTDTVTGGGEAPEDCIKKGAVMWTNSNTSSISQTVKTEYCACSNKTGMVEFYAILNAEMLSRFYSDNILGKSCSQNYLYDCPSLARFERGAMCGFGMPQNLVCTITGANTNRIDKDLSNTPFVGMAILNANDDSMLRYYFGEKMKISGGGHGEEIHIKCSWMSGVESHVY